MMMSLKLWLLLLSCFLGSFVYGQSNQIVFGHLGLKDGLSQNSVVAIAQDSLGFLWIATQDGLNRYDGQEFKYFEKYFWDITKENHTQFGKLMVDDTGLLWILPDSGIPEKYNEELQSFEVISGLEDVNCMFQNRSGAFYFGTKKGLVQRNASNTKDSLLLLDQSVSEIIEDTNNQIWLIANGMVWTKKEGQQFSKVVLLDKNNNTITIRVTCLTQNHNGHILAGTFGKGLFVKSKKEDSFRPIKTDHTTIGNTKILSLLEDRYQRIWIGTYGQGAFLIDSDKDNIQQFKAEKHNSNALSYNDILTIFESNDGNIWLGTDGAGLSFYDKNLSKFHGFTNTQVPANIQIDVVRSILIDQYNKTWLGISGKGLTIHDPENKDKSWITYTTKNSNLPSNRIMSLEEGHDGKIWIGTQGKGLSIFNPTKQTFQNIAEQKLVNGTTWDIHLDQENRYWLATRNSGILEYDLKKGIQQHFDVSNSQLAGNNVRTIINGLHSNELWIGLEEKGICLFDKRTKQFNCFQNKSGNPKVKSLCLADNNILWIGTNGGGLEAFDLKNKTFYGFGTAEGIPNKVIYGILPDRDGNLWLSTNQGICRFTPPQDLSNKDSLAPVIVYDSYDGLQSFEFNTGAYFKDRKENLYFGGINGYNWFNPQDIKANPVIPKIILSDFTVNEKSLLFEINESKSIRLKHWQNDLSFNYSSTCYSLPKRNQYRYQLVGYDENENWVGNRHFAQYTNLPPGDYQLVIKASNYDGTWNEKGLTYTILIAPPWYGTYLAKFVFLLLFLSFLYGIYWFLKRRWQLQAMLQKERQAAQHLKEMNTFKSQVYTNITHEFRTPLTIIKGITTESNLDTKSKGMIQKNANQLLHLVNEILDVSKLESGQLQLNYARQDIIPFLKYQLQAFQSLAKANNHQLLFVAEQESIIMDFDAQKLQQVLTNLIANAIKFTPSGGSISLLSNQQDQHIEIKVKDTGKGIALEHQKQIFDRFYQIDSDSNSIHRGTGIGLSYVKQLIELMEGRIQLESTLNLGTTFQLLLPIRRNAPFILDAKVPAEPLDEKNLAAKKSSPQNLGKEAPHLLIIEDNPDVSFYLKTILEPYYSITFAENGQEGIQATLTTIPDLIISDVMMPVMDGFELCQTLKENELSAHIPIILLTAKAGLESKKAGLKQGADAYLTKPFDKEELLIRVKQLLKLRQKLRNLFTQNPLAPPPNNPIDPFLQKIDAIIEQNLDDEDFKTQELCKALHYSKMQVHRKIKALSDLSTSQYLRQYRLLRAKEMIDQKKGSISEISTATGFKSLSYFSRCFKEQFQFSPAEYIKSKK